MQFFEYHPYTTTYVAGVIIGLMFGGVVASGIYQPGVPAVLIVGFTLSLMTVLLLAALVGLRFVFAFDNEGELENE